MPNPKFQKIISSIRDSTSLFATFEDGLTPDNIKQDIIELLSPYFENKEFIKDVAINYLVSETVEFARVSKEKWSLELFEYILNVHHSAKKTDADQSFQVYMRWIPAKYEGLSKYWSQLHLENDKVNLDLEEFLHECLRNIGGVIEGEIKPLAMELLHQLRISKGKIVTEQDIKALDLGNVFEELIQHSDRSDFFAIEGVRLNQWRNIAQHLSAKVDNGEFLCTYGRVGNEQQIRLSKEKLLEITRRAFMVFAALRLANTIFGIDNLNSFRDKGLIPADVDVRPEAKLLNLVAAIGSQGFEVIDFENDGSSAKIVIKDVSKLDPFVRKLHSVQFVGILWTVTNAQKVTVDYLERDGTPSLRTIAMGEAFVKAEEEGLNLGDIIKEVEIIDLKTNTVIPKLRDNE